MNFTSAREQEKDRNSALLLSRKLQRGGVNQCYISDKSQEAWEEAGGMGNIPRVGKELTLYQLW